MTTAIQAQTPEQSNKHFWYSLETEASTEEIWKIWTEVENWKSWDRGLQDAQLDSPSFQLGAKGRITSLEGRVSKFSLVQFEQGISYTFKTKLPLGGLYVKRYLEEKGDKTRFTHEVWFQGITAGIFAKSFGPKFREMLPGVLQKIKELAEG
ncbi:MAG: SRPBCC domain-containing protein [Bacteroidota bacterium]